MILLENYHPGSEINFNLVNENKLQLESEKSKFNLLCLSPNDFPLVDENFNDNEFTIDSKSMLKLLNKSKFSISNDETRHYLNGVFLHQTEHDTKIIFLLQQQLMVIECLFQKQS